MITREGHWRDIYSSTLPPDRNDLFFEQSRIRPFVGGKVRGVDVQPGYGTLAFERQALDGRKGRVHLSSGVRETSTLHAAGPCGGARLSGFPPAQDMVDDVGYGAGWVISR